MVKQLKLPLGEVLPLAPPPLSQEGNSTFSTFTDNMKLPVHRWCEMSVWVSRPLGSKPLLLKPWNGGVRLSSIHLPVRGRRCLLLRKWGLNVWE
ncbi:hypothetical protein [Microcoleus sp. LAD1_D3]|uniref:hypothetical protein n=1 Tax=Microcoleus sp. LAD1_D3 TaxID=2819365 RepID=UPI002FD3E7A5